MYTLSAPEDTSTSPERHAARFQSTLDRALLTIPFYREWKARDPGPSVPIAQRLAALPVLTKRDLRAHVPDGFMPDSRASAAGFASGDIEIVTTSGTSDDRVSVVWHQAWWDRSEREAARIHPALARLFSRPHREAVLTSPVCAGAVCHVGDASMAERTIGSLLFLNQAQDPTAWDERNVRRMADELREFGPEVLEADPAYLAIMARTARAAGLSLHQPACIVLTYEFPSRIHLRAIGRAFPDVPVVSSYGSTETGHVFTQCSHGTFHQNLETSHVDIQPFQPGRGDPAIGRILVSTLDNPWFTLLRFDVGDLARVRGGAPCPCGRREGLAIAAIEGRLRDVTFDTEGRVVTVKGLDDALDRAPGLTGYQVVQSAPTRYVVRFTAEPGEEAATAGAVQELLKGLYGARAEIQTLRENVISPEQSGKFRLSRSTLPVRPEELCA